MLCFCPRWYVGRCCVCFSFSVLSQEAGWEERLRSDLFCVGWDSQSIYKQCTAVDCFCHSRIMHAACRSVDTVVYVLPMFHIYMQSSAVCL